jgi:hypothetical protein
MLRRLMFLAFLCVVASLASMAPAASAQSVGGCQLDGTASFSPGLNNSARDFEYSFNGSLSECGSSEAGVPTSGTVSAGEPVFLNLQMFQEPVPTGNGGCTNSTTSGTAIVSWSDGTQTVVRYSTTGAAAAVHLQGTVVPSVTLQAINPQVGQPTSTTVVTTRYAGNSARGLLAFEPPDPTACATPGGVTTAGISGVIGLASPS